MITAFRLQTGEDVFGTVKNENEWLENDTVEIDKPAVIQMRVDEKTKQPMVGFAPYNPFGENTAVKIKSDKIVMSYSPKREIENAYSQTQGSGLIKPTGPLPNLKI
tara:strand:+ start:388 stop:705 length:318 start_codon:yes stop_codon:yes gene_type:complete